MAIQRAILIVVKLDQAKFPICLDYTYFCLGT